MRHIAASVPVCVNGQYADKPHVVGIIGQPLTLHKAQNAILSPPTWWGGTPLGAGGQSQMPRIQSCIFLCNWHKCRSQNAAPAPRPQRRISALPPLEWLPHRLTRRTPHVDKSRRRDYAANSTARGRKSTEKTTKSARLDKIQTSCAICLTMITFYGIINVLPKNTKKELPHK